MSSLLRLSPTGPSSLSLHASGGHIDNFNVRIPQAPVEAQTTAGAGHRVRGTHQGPSKQVQGGTDIRRGKTGPQVTVQFRPGMNGPVQSWGVMAGVSCGQKAQDMA